MDYQEEEDSGFRYDRVAITDLKKANVRRSTNGSLSSDDRVSLFKYSMCWQLSLVC